jgi:hypothetical protein
VAPPVIESKNGRDPERPEDLAQRAEAVGHATEGTVAGRLEAIGAQRRINFLTAMLRKQLRGSRTFKLAFAAVRQSFCVTGLPQSLDRRKDGIAHSLLFDPVVGPH